MISPRIELRDAQEAFEDVEGGPGLPEVDVVPQVQADGGAGLPAAVLALGDPEEVAGAVDGDVELRAEPAGGVHAAGGDADLVGEHEVAQHTDAETAVGVQLYGRVGLSPLGAFEFEVQLLGEAGAGVGEDAPQLGFAHADAVVLAFQVGAAVLVHALAELDAAFVGESGAQGVGAVQVLGPRPAVAAGVEGVLVELADGQVPVTVQLHAHQQAAHPAFIQPEPRPAGEGAGGGGGLVGGEAGGEGVRGEYAADGVEELVGPGRVLAQAFDHRLVPAFGAQDGQVEGAAPDGQFEGPAQIGEVDLVRDAEVFGDDVGQRGRLDRGAVGEGDDERQPRFPDVLFAGGAQVVVLAEAGEVVAVGDVGASAEAVQDGADPLEGEGFAEFVQHRQSVEDVADALGIGEVLVLVEPAVVEPPADGRGGVGAGAGAVGEQIVGLDELLVGRPVAVGCGRGLEVGRADGRPGGGQVQGADPVEKGDDRQ